MAGPVHRENRTTEIATGVKRPMDSFRATDQVVVDAELSLRPYGD